MREPTWWVIWDDTMAVESTWHFKLVAKMAARDVNKAHRKMKTGRSVSVWRAKTLK